MRGLTVFFNKLESENARLRAALSDGIADEIERLRSENERLRELIGLALESLAYYTQGEYHGSSIVKAIQKSMERSDG